jgi:NIMA (never in mitosis gene a)-related kinase
MISTSSSEPESNPYGWRKISDLSPNVGLWEDTDPPNKMYVIKWDKRKTIERETNLLIDLQMIHRHENIVRFYRTLDDLDDAKQLGLVVGYCEQGDVFELCCQHWCPEEEEDEPKRVPESLIWKIAMEALNGLHFMHTSCKSSAAEPFHDDWHPIIHCDIKHKNLFVDSDGKVRIGDFGLSKTLPAGETEASWKAGTPGFFAPEFPMVSQASDIWSLGVTIHYCATGEEVVSIASDISDWQNQHKSINIHDLTVPPEDRTPNTSEGMATDPMMGVYSVTLNHFLGRMLALNPKDRPTAGKLLQDMEDVHNQIRRLGRSREMSWDDMIASLPLVTPCGPPLIEIDSD